MTERNSGPTGLPETVTYEPLPSIYRAFAAGATPFAIITETIDNAIDFVRRQALNGEFYPSTLEVDIRFEPFDDVTKEDLIIENDPESSDDEQFDPIEGRLIITDNAGGVPPNELAKFFQLGHSDAPPEGIGRFGVGAKRLIGIGDHIKYESHAHGHEIAAGFEVDAGRLEDGSNEVTKTAYTSEVYQVDDLEENKTRIIVEDLNRGVWERLCGADGWEIDRSSEDTLWRLEETYEHFLRDDIQIDPTDKHREETIEFDLSWGIYKGDGEDEGDGGDTTDTGPSDMGDERETPLAIDETVVAPERVELSFVPFDGLWPRRYEEMPFANDAETSPEECLRVDIEVGLLPRSMPDKAGLTVTMNNRNVLFRDTANDLFSTRYLGKFRSSAGHGRLHCIVSIHGAASDMPWSDTKDALDGTQEVTDEILNVAENALKEYRRQTYDNFPDWALEVYSIDQLKQRGYFGREDFLNRPEHIDKSNSKVNNPRFNSKPGETSSSSSYRQFPVRDNLIRTVYLHAGLRIRCDNAMVTLAKPAYENYFETVYEGPQLVAVEEPDLPIVDDYFVPLRSEKEDTITLIADIQKLAKRTAADRERISDETEGVAPWFLPRYTEELENSAGDVEIQLFSVIESFDLEKWRGQHSTDEEIRLDVAEEPGNNGIPSRHPDSGGSQPRSPSADESPISIFDRSSETESKRDTPSSADSGLTEYTSSADQTAIDRDVQATLTEEVGDSTPEPGLRINGEFYALSDDEIEALINQLDLDEDAAPETVLSSILESLELLEKLKTHYRKIGALVNVESVVGEEPAIDLDS